MSQELRRELLANLKTKLAEDPNARVEELLTPLVLSLPILERMALLSIIICATDWDAIKQKNVPGAEDSRAVAILKIMRSAQWRLLEAGTGNGHEHLVKKF